MDRTLTTSPSAKAIEVYCHALAQELGLTLESVWWGYALHPAHIEAPYNLHISVLKPFEAIPEFWFTREKMLGYVTGETKAAIEGAIRTDLEAHIRDDVEPPAQGARQRPERSM
jgi:hypothetical protein